MKIFTKSDAESTFNGKEMRFFERLLSIDSDFNMKLHQAANDTTKDFLWMGISGRF
jgi:hypothetical protein